MKCNICKLPEMAVKEVINEEITYICPKCKIEFKWTVAEKLKSVK